MYKDIDVFRLEFQCKGIINLLLDKKNIEELSLILYDLKNTSRDEFTAYINPDGSKAYDEYEEYENDRLMKLERIKELGEIKIYDALMRGDLIVAN